MQVTYNDIPLYYFQADEKAGDTKGQAVGGVWWVVAPGLSQITPAVGEPSPVTGLAGSRPREQRLPQPRSLSPPRSPAACRPWQQPGANLPRTGGTPLSAVMLVLGTGAAGIAATAVGTRLLRRGRRRS